MADLLWFIGYYIYKVGMKHFHGWYNMPWHDSKKVALAAKIAKNGCFRIIVLAKKLEFLKNWLDKVCNFVIFRVSWWSRDEGLSEMMASNPDTI